MKWWTLPRAPKSTSKIANSIQGRLNINPILLEEILGSFTRYCLRMILIRQSRGRLSKLILLEREMIIMIKSSSYVDLRIHSLKATLKGTSASSVKERMGPIMTMTTAPTQCRETQPKWTGTPLTRTTKLTSSCTNTVTRTSPPKSRASSVAQRQVSAWAGLPPSLSSEKQKPLT